MGRERDTYCTGSRLTYLYEALLYFFGCLAVIGISRVAEECDLRHNNSSLAFSFCPNPILWLCPLALSLAPHPGRTSDYHQDIPRASPQNLQTTSTLIEQLLASPMMQCLELKQLSSSSSTITKWQWMQQSSEIHGSLLSLDSHPLSLTNAFKARRA